MQKTANKLLRQGFIRCNFGKMKQILKKKSHFTFQESYRFVLKKKF